MLAVDTSRQHKEPRVGPDGTTILFGLHWERVRHTSTVKPTLTPDKANTVQLGCLTVSRSAVSLVGAMLRGVRV